ncbi:MAG: response regulator receiver protein, partial [Devosia sp.]|nr:response regulator receiver protein [Devosia sp.]
MNEFAGLRALVVEDEGAVALLIEDMLEEMGCHVVASVATLAKALTAAATENFDFAMLDVNLDGQPVFPVAEVLQSRGLPFIFSTGYGRNGVPKRFELYEVLSKPFTMAELKQKLFLTVQK